MIGFRRFTWSPLLDWSINWTSWTNLEPRKIRKNFIARANNCRFIVLHKRHCDKIKVGSVLGSLRARGSFTPPQLVSKLCSTPSIRSVR
jgi:hypothetical protein